MKIATLLTLCILAGCSREQTNAIGNSVAKTHNESYKDNVVKNWQAKVASTPACSVFKDRFQTAGSRYDNASNGLFIGDMMKVWDATKAAGCAASI
jgi:hypothetical protein